MRIKETDSSNRISRASKHLFSIRIGSKKVSTENLRRYRETEIGIMAYQETLERRDDMRRMIEFLAAEIERRERCGQA